MKRRVPRSINNLVDETVHHVLTMVTTITQVDNVQDIYALFVADSQYTDLQEKYGYFAYDRVTCDFGAQHPVDTTLANQQLGVFGVQEGIYNYSTRSYVSVCNIPNSFWLHNCVPTSFSYPVKGKQWFSSLTTNSATSMVPKVTLFYGVYKANTSGSAFNQPVIVKLYMRCKEKIA